MTQNGPPGKGGPEQNTIEDLGGLLQYSAPTCAAIPNNRKRRIDANRAGSAS